MDFTKPWQDYTYVAFDTETSGKFPLVAEVVEVAAVKWRGGKIIDSYQTLVKPSRPMGEAVIRIHHITNEMVENAPNISAILPKFDAFIQDSVLVAHHAAFDIGFLTLEYEKHNMALPTACSIDSCLLARKVFPKSTNHRLATLVALFDIKIENAHRALDDSKACLEVAMKCMEKVGQEATLEHLFKIQGTQFEWTRYSMKDLLSNEVTRPLVEGARKQLVLEITYKGGSHPGEPRRITPQGLVRNPEGDYIVGLCHQDNTEKRFYLNRISSAKILD